MRRGDGTVAYLFYDQVGSLRVVADLDGNVIREITYDPFGGIIRDTNPALPIPIGFAGGLHDKDLGFVRFGWRDYDVNTGRWTAPDPIGDKGGDPDWYGYCLDDPVNMVDYSGLAYAGNDFGPGYNGTSGSAYGPTSKGWGYKSNPGGSLHTGNSDVKSENNATDQTLAGKRKDPKNTLSPLKTPVPERVKKTIHNAYLEHKRNIARHLTHLNLTEEELDGVKMKQGVFYNGKGIAIGELGLKNPDIDPVMDFIPAIGAAKTSSIIGKSIHQAYKVGKEVKFGKNVRIAPFGNRKGDNWYNHAPHYHRRGPYDPIKKETIEGQGIGRHRPWKKSKKDKGPLDRF